MLSRAIYDSAIWTHNPHVLKLFIYLIGEARFKKDPKKYSGFMQQRGEVITSLRDIAEDNEYLERNKLCKWSRQRVGRMINTLEDEGYVKVLADTYGTHLSIVNYDTYQNPNTYKADRCGTGAEQVRTSSGPEVGTTNKGNKGNKGNNGNKEPIYRKVQHLELSLSDHKKLVDLFGTVAVDDILDDMENWRDLKKKKSAYLTARKWLKNNQSQQPPQDRVLPSTPQ